MMVGVIRDESFFCTLGSPPRTIDKGKEIRVPLPRLLPSEEIESLLDTAQSQI